MNCILCSNEIEKSGTVRPNIATFDCGHEFHLDCVIDYCKSHYTKQCPSCYKNPNSKYKPNFSQERLLAIETLIEARRNNRETKTDTGYLQGLNSWFNSKKSTLISLVKNGTSLNTLKVNGYTPEDFIEQKISWKNLSSVYTADALIDYGFRFHHMIVMGFCPEHFKGFTWEQLYNTLQIRSDDMLKTSLTTRQLADLKFPIQNIRQLGFTWKDLVTMDGNVKTLRLLTDNLSDLKTYFNPSANDWENAGFTRERITLYKWKTDDFTPVRNVRNLQKTTNTSKITF